MNNSITSKDSIIKALYIHIPFCNCICTYCDFYKMIAKKETKHKYIQFLEKELRLKQNYLSNIETIYIGGGTPSCLDVEELEQLFGILNKYVNLSKLNEFTIECNPADINEEKIILWKKNRINRISLGVQSFNDKKLSILGRKHDKGTVFNAVKLIKHYGISNINIDLIYGLNETREDILDELNNFISLDIPHVSTYSLILEEHTILYNNYKKGNFSLMDDNRESEIYFEICSFLNKLGYSHYEISNFAKKGYECLHNLTYWNNEHYLGIGASSSYYIDNIRYTNLKNLTDYFNCISNKQLIYYEKTILSKKDVLEEELILGFRKIKGINLLNFREKYKMNFFDVFPKAKNMIDQGFLEINENNIYIPAKYLYLSNEIIVRAL